MLRCTPFLLFDGNCAEAMTFYQRCLGGQLTLTKLGDTPMKDQFPEEKYNRIINAHLVSGDFEFSAADWMASPSFDPIQGNTYAIFTIGGKFEQLKRVFDKLAESADPEHFRSYTTCRSEHTGSFLTSMASSGSFEAINKKKERKYEGLLSPLDVS